MDLLEHSARAPPARTPGRICSLSAVPHGPFSRSPGGSVRVSGYCHHFPAGAQRAAPTGDLGGTTEGFSSDLPATITGTQYRGKRPLRRQNSPRRGPQAGTSRDPRTTTGQSIGRLWFGASCALKCTTPRGQPFGDCRETQVGRCHRLATIPARVIIRPGGLPYRSLD